MGWGRWGWVPTLLYLLNVLYLLYLLSILYSSAGTHFSSIKTEFFFKSKASRMASPTTRPSREKSAWVWSGFRPHRVVSCGLPIAASTMQFAPCSPRLFRSRLRARRVPQHSVRELNTASEGADSVGMIGFYLSEVIVEFILRAAAKVAGPSGVDRNLVCSSPSLS